MKTLIILIIFFITSAAEADVENTNCQDSFFLKEKPLSNSHKSREQIPELPADTTPSVKPLTLLNVENHKKFLEALRNKQFKGDNRYIELIFSIRSTVIIHYFMRVIDFNNDVLTVDRITLDGHIVRTKLANRDVLFISARTFDFIMISPASKQWFDRIQNAPKTIEIKTTQTNEEAAQPIKGLRSVFTKGRDEGVRLQNLGEGLRKANINPFTTHVVNFSNQIDRHISFIREGLYRQNSRLIERLEILNNFEKEAKERQKNHDVTYAWWLLWNYRLSILASPSLPKTMQTSNNPNWWKTDKSIEELLQDPSNAKNLSHTHESILDFPNTILLPTIKDIGIIALRKASINGISHVQLIEQNVTVHGTIYSPADFFIHDILHMLFKYSKGEWDSKNSMKRYHEEFDKKMKTLSVQEREMAELGYFLLSHEIKPEIDKVLKIENPEDMRYMFLTFLRLFQDEGELGSLLPKNINIKSKQDVKQYLEESSRVFNRISAEILNTITHDKKAGDAL